jgi:hypothetical protein
MAAEALKVTVQTTAPTTMPDVGEADEPAAAAERVNANKQHSKTTATAATGKRSRFLSEAEKNGEVGRTPGMIVEIEGGDNTTLFAFLRPIVDLDSSHDGLGPSKQQFRARLNNDNLGVSDYQLSQIQDFVQQAIDAVISNANALHTATSTHLVAVEEVHAATTRELAAINQKLATLEALLETQGIQQNQVAASIAHQQRQQPQQQQQHRQQPQQQQQQGPGNTNPPFRRPRPAPELDKEEFPTLPPASEWKVRESRYAQGARKRQVREEEVAREREVERRERERMERERVLRARGPPLLVPKVKFPWVQRQIVVTFDPLKRPENMSDKAIADMALQLVNKDIVDRKDVRTPLFFSACITPHNNLILVAADHIKVIMYENYLGVIANALHASAKPRPHCTRSGPRSW